MDHRRAADEAQTRRVDRDAEADRVRLGFLAVGDVGRWHDQEVVGIGAQRRDHARAADDDPAVRFLDDLRGQVFGLLLDRFRAVDLRVDQRVGQAEVAVADLGVVGLQIVGEALVALAELVGGAGEAR